MVWEMSQGIQSSLHGGSIATNLQRPGHFGCQNRVLVAAAASGGTCWEWLYFGLRGAIISIAENQDGVYRSLVSRDLAVGLGHGNSVIGQDGGRTAISEFLDGKSPLSQASLIDGYGTDRHRGRRFAAPGVRQPVRQRRAGDGGIGDVDLDPRDDRA